MIVDAETRQWIVTVASVTLAPVLTFIIAFWRVRRLGLNKDNMLIVNERAEFRREQIARVKAQDDKIERQDEVIETMRRLNNKLFGRVMYLEAVMKAKGIKFNEDNEVEDIE
jgi:hypothetical protein